MVIEKKFNSISEISALQRIARPTLSGFRSRWPAGKGPGHSKTTELSRTAKAVRDFLYHSSAVKLHGIWAGCEK